MAAKFTSGDDQSTTRRLVAKSPPKNVRTRSHSLDGGNTMSGMPGYLNAHEPQSSAHMRGGKGVGPKREGSIGRRGGSGARELDHAGKAARGTTTGNYKAISTGRPGAIKGNAHTGARHVHTARSGGKMEKFRGTVHTRSERPHKKSMMY
jgi:hypothetical protein